MAPPHTRLTLRWLLRRPVLVVWVLYVLLIPFYVVRGGLPQPGDVLIVVVVPAAVAGWDGRLGRSSIRTVRALLWFTAWVALVSLAWAVLLWSWGTNLLYPLYYVYNAAFFFSALVLYQRFGDRFLRLTIDAVLLVTLFQVAASFVIGSATRQKLFFSNPNQLGYYALIAACMIVLTQKRLGLGVLKCAIGLCACTYLALLSASRSSAAGILFLTLLLVLSNPRLLVIAALALVSLTVLDTPIDDSLETLQTRVSQDRMPNHSFWEQRGYDRIWANKPYAVFGAAEGNFWRFKETTALGGAEIHSSAGTLLFCYGLPGVLLFGLFLFQLARGAPIRTAGLLLPVLLYSAAHQGMRFTMLWVLFALYCALKDRAR
jgi:hypothetical protein